MNNIWKNKPCCFFYWCADSGDARHITSSTESQLLQCSSSLDQSGQASTPNIPDYYFNDRRAAYLRTGYRATLTTVPRTRGNTFIFTIPFSEKQKCSGNVISFQYCYQARNWDIGRTHSVFHFLSLARDGLQFAVKRRYTVQTTPGEKICTKLQYSRTFTCCDKTDLDVGTQLLIPPEDYTFGIVTASSAVRPLAFAAQLQSFMSSTS